MFCIQCGQRNPETAKFCKQCGAQIAASDDLAPDAAPQAAPPEEPAQPAPAPAAERLAEAYRKMVAGDHAGALAGCTEALALDPASRDAYVLLSALREQAGDLPGAIAARERVVELAPDSAIDRDKLDALRAQSAAPAARGRMAPLRELVATPVGALAAAIGMMTLVLVVGGAVVLARPHRQVVNAPAPQAPPMPPAAMPGMQVPTAQSRVVVNPGVAVNMARPPAMPPGYPGSAGMTGAPGAGAYAGMAPGGGVPPAAVASQSTPALENDPRYAGRQPSAPDTVHLPDNANNAQPAATQSETPPARASAPVHDPGRIEIVVGPQTTLSTSPNNPGSRLPTQRDSQAPARGSQTQLSYAQHLQLQGNYREAVTAYRQALDGAGDQAPDILVKIALCQTRLGDRRAAAAAYTEAIAACNDQIKANRNVEAARTALRTATFGLKGNQ